MGTQKNKLIGCAPEFLGCTAAALSIPFGYVGGFGYSMGCFCYEAYKAPGVISVAQAIVSPALAAVAGLAGIGILGNRTYDTVHDAIDKTFTLNCRQAETDAYTAPARSVLTEDSQQVLDRQPSPSYLPQRTASLMTADLARAEQETQPQKMFLSITPV